MFRIFLRKKLYSGDKPKTTKAQNKLQKAKNRRTLERFEVDQQHLTVMNDQDILVIRDISAKGFSSVVSSRAYDRFELHDIYAARMRNHGEVGDIQIRLAWKRELMVGFELYQPDEARLAFFQRLIRPIELANSLTQVDAAFMRDQHAGLIWFHGEQIDLHIWSNDEQNVSAWQLIAYDHIIEWSSVHGVKTGSINRHEHAPIGIPKPGEVSKIMDPSVVEERLQFAKDIIAALPFSERTELAKTLDDEAAS